MWRNEKAKTSKEKLTDPPARELIQFRSTKKKKNYYKKELIKVSMCMQHHIAIHTHTDTPREIDRERAGGKRKKNFNSQ